MSLDKEKIKDDEKIYQILDKWIDFQHLNIPKSQTKSNEESSNLERQQSRSATLDNDNKEQDMQLRRTCTFLTLGGVGGWLLFVSQIVLYQGIDFIPFHLSEGVTITLLSTTTANVIGGLFIIYRYLFKDSS